MEIASALCVEGTRENSAQLIQRRVEQQSSSSGGGGSASGGCDFVEEQKRQVQRLRHVVNHAQFLPIH